MSTKSAFDAVLMLGAVWPKLTDFSTNSRGVVLTRRRSAAVNERGVGCEKSAAIARRMEIFARASASKGKVSVGVTSAVFTMGFSSMVLIICSFARLGVLLLDSNRVEERQNQRRMKSRRPGIERVHGSHFEIGWIESLREAIGGPRHVMSL